MIALPIYKKDGSALKGSVEPSKSVPWKSQMHRGYGSSTIAENTLPAFYRAFLNGADTVEIDIRTSSDDVFVVAHDASVVVNGTTYVIAENTAETLTSLTLSTDPEYGACKLPTLYDVLKLCLFTGMGAHLDCKDIDVSKLAEFVVENGMQGKCTYDNTYKSDVSTILAIDPDAGFTFNGGTDIADWATNYITNHHNRQKSYAWFYPPISAETLKSVRSYGFNVLMTNINASNSNTYMGIRPDMIEFATNADCKALNNAYLESLELF